VTKRGRRSQKRAWENDEGGTKKVTNTTGKESSHPRPGEDGEDSGKEKALRSKEAGRTLPCEERYISRHWRRKSRERFSAKMGGEEDNDRSSRKKPRGRDGH